MKSTSTGYAMMVASSALAGCEASARQGVDCPACPSCPPWLLIVTGFAIAALVGAAVGFMLGRWVSSTSPDAASHKAASGVDENDPSEAQLALVRARVRAHREAMLCYFIGTECRRHDLPDSVVTQALDGRAPVRSWPVLSLLTPDFLWRSESLHRAVERVMSEESLVPPTDLHDPMGRLEQAIQNWAEAEAVAVVSRWVRT